MRSMGYETLADWAEVLKQQLADVGIDVQVEGGDFDFVVDKGYVQHDFDTLWGGLGVNDPGVGVSRLYRSDNIGDAPFNNAAAYSNPEMDELWATYSSTFDEETRREAIFRMSRKFWTVVKHYVGKQDWDYLQCVDIGLDRVHHGFWKYHDPGHVLHEPNSPFKDVIRDYYLHLDHEGRHLDAND